MSFWPTIENGLNLRQSQLKPFHATGSKIPSGANRGRRGNNLINLFNKFSIIAIMMHNDKL